MPYTLKKGNLISSFKSGDYDVMVHGCNCYNIMGAGFAKQVKSKFPGAFEADKNFMLPKGSYRLGNYSTYIDENDNYIINAYTQINTGKNFDLSAFEIVMRKIEYEFIGAKIAVPGLIGCGIGGGDSKKVLELLDQIFQKNTLYIVYPD